MIRSLIGIVSVLVLLTTCVQSTAAQPRGNSYPNPLRDGGAQTQLRHWIELADQGVSERILSSDAYHDDFRFRAAPVKQSRNWQMPIVDVRCAKDISITLEEKVVTGSPVSKSQPSAEIDITPVVDWVRNSAFEVSGRYCELCDQFKQITLTIVPHLFPLRSKDAEPKEILATGRTDYWNYYTDCDRWNVVFAKPGKAQPAKLASDPKIANENATVQQEPEIKFGLQDLVTQVAGRWEEAISLYRAISQRFLTSQ